VVKFLYREFGRTGQKTMHYVIIGTSAAGMGVISKLSLLAPDAKITCISDEAAMPYNKCFLDDWLLQKIGIDRVYTRPQKFFTKHNIDLRLSSRVIKLEPEDKRITFFDGSTLNYDRLFIGTGTSPRDLKLVEAQDSLPLFYFHGLKHAADLINFINTNKARKTVVIGAGLSGLECADGLLSRGLEVSIVESNSQLLPSQVDWQGSQLILKYLQQRGGCLYADDRVTQLMNKSVILSSGATLEADLVVNAAGAQVNTKFARKAGLDMDGDYLCVDDNQQTSNPSIFAGGDCVKVRDIITGLRVPSSTWPDAMLQGVTAAHNMAGLPKRYPGALVLTSSAFFGVQFVTCGNVNNVPDGYNVRVTTGDDWYHKLIFDERNILRSFLLVGNTNGANRLKRAIQTGEPVG